MRLANDPQSLFEYLKQAGILGLAVLLAVLLRWALQKIFAMYDKRETQLEGRIGELEDEVKELRKELASERANWITFSRESTPVMREVVALAARRKNTPAG